MLTIFIIKKAKSRLYITTSENYSKVLQKLGVEPDEAIFWTIGYETLHLVYDNQTEYISRDN